MKEGDVDKASPSFLDFIECRAPLSQQSGLPISPGENEHPQFTVLDGESRLRRVVSDYPDALSVAVDGKFVGRSMIQKKHLTSFRR